MLGAKRTKAQKVEKEREKKIEREREGLIVQSTNLIITDNNNNKQIILVAYLENYSITQVQTDNTHA